MTKMDQGFLSVSLQILFADEPDDCLLFGPYIVSWFVEKNASGRAIYFLLL